MRQIEGFFPEQRERTLVRNSDVGRVDALNVGAQVMRWDTGMPRRVMMLMTLQPMAASAFCVIRAPLH